MPGRLTLDTLADVLASGELSPEALVVQTIERARSSGSVFIDIFEQQALIEAEAASRRRETGRARGPFDGIPFAVKDLIDVAGTVTTAGSRTRTNAMPASEDAALITRLRRHGMIPIGKTNLSEFAFSGLGLNPHFGTPTAVERADRVPGGSSSGSAVALANGVVAAALGTDTAGSIRVPSAFNGLAGLRPSSGRYDATGIFPLAPSFDVPGPMANTVADCVTLDRMMRGHSLSGENQPLPKMVLETGLLDDDELDANNRSAVVAFAERAEANGAQVSAKPILAIRKAGEAIRQIGWLGGVEAFEVHGGRLAGPERDLIDPRVVTRLEHSATMSSSVVEALWTLRQSLVAEIGAELDGAVLITPVTLIRPPLLAPLMEDNALFARVNLQALFVTMIGSFLGMPGIAIPVGDASDGLPASVLLSSAPGGDDRILAAASWTSTL
jgi:aspartyl-tRNA(Asn)/glutamyl-tRNA(Gln) amidotransferase subunit A